MSNTSFFKKESPKDVSQDSTLTTVVSDVSGLQTQVSNIHSAETWSQYNATQNVNMNNNALNNVSTVTTNSDIIVGGKLRFNNSTGVFIRAEGDQLTTLGSLYANKYFTINDYIQCNGDGYFGVDLNANQATLSVDKANNKVTTDRGASIDGFNNVNITGDMTCNTLNYTTLSPAIPQYTPNVSANTYYVDKSGNDTTGNGSLEKPYLTIQKAVNVAELAYDGTAKEIKLGFGSYVENITIKKARIQITGSSPTRYVNTACSITGNIVLQVVGETDMFNSQVCIIGVQVVGHILDYSSSVHTLVIKDCYIYESAGVISQNTTADCRTYIENCVIQASKYDRDNEMIGIYSGAIQMIIVK